jgi:alkanesulfonate monooxygenase SsuD/methylene tetrahydromethanopterin reductase-like flavin-dependent oxidoreductase (luciferase family)
MKIGIGLPGTIPDVAGNLVFEWAREAEKGPFSSLGLIDRLVYGNYEPLTTLAAVAGITQRVRLMTTVLLAPLHNAAILAKQAATIDALSGGRLTLGLGVGNREDDYEMAQVPFHRRGKIFEEQLGVMTKIWSGQAISDKIGAIGPKPAQVGGPEILISGYTPVAIERLSRWGSGFIAGGSPPEQTQQLFQLVRESWQKGNRPGKPRLIGSIYYGLGPGAAEQVEKYITHYYSFLGPMAQQMAKMVPSTPEALRGAIQGYKDVGCDELMIWPCVPQLDQVQRLADIVS